MQADYVIVGAGSAGCVLANRLSADPQTRVVLIEAGPRDTNPLIHIPAGYMKLMDHPTADLGLSRRARPRHQRARHPLPARARLGRLQLDQRHDLCARPARGFRPLGAARQSRLVVGRRLALFQAGRGLGGRRGRVSRQGRAAVDLAHRRQAGAVPKHHRGRQGDRPRIPCRRKPSAARRRRQYRLGPADPPRPAAPKRRAHVSAPGVEAAEPPGRDRRAWCTACASTASARPASNLPAAAVLERADAAREVIVAAGAVGSPHLLQLSGVGDPDHLGRVGIGVQHALPGVGKNLQDHYLARVTAAVTGIRTDERKVARPALCRRDPALSLRRHRHADLRRLAGLRLGQGAGGIGDPRRADACSPTGSFAPGPVRRLDDTPGMTGGMWQMRPLSRGYVEAKSNLTRRGAGDQPALPLRRDRPPRRDRRAAFGPAPFRRAGAIPLCRRRDPPRQRGTRATTSSSTTPANTARPCSTPPAPARWARTPWRSSTTICASTASRACASSTLR